jgi:transcriptional regulator with XRE-family HTH domain
VQRGAVVASLRETVVTMEINPAQRAGKILRMLRDEAGMTQAELAKAALSSATMISYLETGTKRANGDLIHRIGETLGHRDLLIEVWGFTTDSSYSTELHVAQEADAIRIHDWESRICPGLLQTPQYARAVIRAALPREREEIIDQAVSARMNRQSILSGENPPIVWFVIDEAVLCKPYGGRQVMRDQLLKLEEQAEQPNMIIQIMPFSAVRHPGLEGPLRIMEFQENPPIWYTEGWSSGRMTEVKDEVLAAVANFDLIRASALSPEQSAEFIASVRGSRYE